MVQNDLSRSVACFSGFANIRGSLLAGVVQSISSQRSKNSLVLTFEVDLRLESSSDFDPADLGSVQLLASPSSSSFAQRLVDGEGATSLERDHGPRTFRVGCVEAHLVEGRSGLRLHGLRAQLGDSQIRNCTAFPRDVKIVFIFINI